MTHSATRRHLHPGAWWVWALSLGVCAVRTTNPLLLLLIVGVAGFVVAARRSDAPWAHAYSTFLKVGVVIVVFRVVIVALAGESLPGRVLVTLPEVPLPDWAAGITLGGAITAERVAAGFYEGLRFATLVACFGAANALASPYRLLRCVPGVLYEAAVAVAVALSFAPQAVMSVTGVLEARRLRGRPTRGIAAVRGLAVPVLEGALRRSLLLAESLDARGYGRRGATTDAGRRTTTALTIAGLLLAAVGLYGLLDTTPTAFVGLPAMSLGGLLLLVGLVLGGRQHPRTRYRPDRWRGRELLVAGSGIASLGVMLVAGRIDALGLAPSTQPLVMPTLPWLATAGLLVALLPAVAAPEPPITGTPRPRAARPQVTDPATAVATAGASA